MRYYNTQKATLNNPENKQDSKSYYPIMLYSDLTCLDNFEQDNWIDVRSSNGTDSNSDLEIRNSLFVGVTDLDDSGSKSSLADKDYCCGSI